MADITKTGPMTYRQLQEENSEDSAERIANAYINSGIQPFRLAPINPLDYIREGYTKSALQRQSEAQNKNDYWGHSMWDSDTLTYGEFSDASKILDKRAENQPWYAQLGAGIAKGVLTAGTTFLDGTLGLMYGVTDALVNNDAAKLFDNELSNAIMGLNRQAEEWLPNYRTTEEQEDPWYKHLNMNFWADSFIKNLGFTVGAYYSGAAWTKLLKGIGALKSGMAAQVIGSVMSGLNEGRVEANNLVYDTMQLKSQQINDAYNARRNEIIAKYSDNNGNLFDAQSAQEEINTLDKQRDGLLRQAHDDADKAGLGDMIANTIFLSMDNMYAFGRLYSRGFQTAARATGRAGLSGWGKVKAGWKAADELMGNELAENVGENAGKYVWNNISKKQAALNSAKIGLLEGNEELMQEFFAQTAGEYYSPDSPDAYYQAMIDGKSNVETQDFFTAISKGFAQSYGDGSQWEQFAVGMLTGLLGMPTFGRTNNADSNTYIGKGRWFGLSGGIGGEFTHVADVNRRGKEAVDVMNSFKDTVDRNKARFAQSDFFTGIANGAAAAGDQFSFESARDNDMAAAFASFMNTGRESDFRDLVNQDFENMSNDELLNIARNTDNEAHQWVSEDGNWLPNVDPETMRNRLIENRDETLKQLDEYKKALLEVRAIANNSLSQSEENEKTWERWKLSQFGNRGNSIVSQHQDEIQEIIGTNEATLNNIADFLKEHFPNDEDAKFSRIGDFLWQATRGIKNWIKPLSDEERDKWISSKPDKNGIIKHKRLDGAICYEDTVTGLWYRVDGESYKTVLKAIQERRIRDGYTADGKNASENTQEEQIQERQTEQQSEQSSREIPQRLSNARFSIERKDDGSFGIVFDSTSSLTYDGVMNFAKNLNYLNTLLKLLANNKDRDGMISAFLTNTMTSPDLISALKYFNSDVFEEVFSKIIPNFLDFKKLVSDLQDVALLGDAYRKLNDDYNEWAKDPLSIRKNRDRLDKEEKAKQAKESRRRSRENIDRESEIDLLRKAIFDGETLDIDRALSDDNKDQASKDKAKRVRDGLNWYRNTIAAVKKKTNDRDVINGLINALHQQLQAADSIEDFMNTNTEIIQNANYVSEDERDKLESMANAIEQARANGINTDSLEDAFEAQLDKVTKGNSKALEVIENAAIEASNESQELDETADKIEKAKEEEEGGKDDETGGADPTPKPIPSGIVNKDNAEQAAEGRGAEPLDEDDLNIPEGVETIETPVLTDDDFEKLQQQSISHDEMPEGKFNSTEYDFWKSNTTEFGRRLVNPLEKIYQMTNEPYWRIVDEGHKNLNLYKAAYEYLVNHGAFDRIKKGVLKEGTEIRFGVSKELSDKAGRPIILLLANYPKVGTDGNKVDDWQPIGDLITSADYVFKYYKGLDDFYKTAIDKYNEQRDKTDSDLVILDGLSTHINKVYIGQPRYVSERSTINEIFDGESFKIGIKINGAIYSGRNKEVCKDGLSGKNGQPYILIHTPDSSRPYMKVPVIMDEFHGTRDNPISEIVCDMFDELSKFDPEYIKTEKGKDSLEDWQKRMSQLLTRKCVIIPYPKDGHILVKFSTGETYSDKNGKQRDKYDTLFKGHPKKLTPKMVENFFNKNGVPYQVSLSYINGDINYKGRNVSYNQLIGAVMKTNLAVGETTAVNNFFTVNPIIDGVEEKGSVIQSKQSKTKTDIPQDTSGVISSDGKYKFTLKNGENIYIDKNTYDVTDKEGKPYKVSQQQAAYMYGIMVGLFNKDNVTDEVNFMTPFNDKPFWPSKMKFEDAKINIKDATETPISDIKFIHAEAIGDITREYSVAPKTIITLPDSGKVMLSKIVLCENNHIVVVFNTTDKNNNLETKSVFYDNIESGIPRIILDILSNNNINTSKYNVLQDINEQQQQQERQQEQQLSEDEEYQKKLEEAKSRKGSSTKIQTTQRAKVEPTTISPSRVSSGPNDTVVIYTSDENRFRTNSGDSYVLLPIDAVDEQLRLLQINLDNVKEVRLRSICYPYKQQGFIKCITDIVDNNGNIETQVIDCSVFLDNLIKNRGLDIELTAKDYLKAQQKAKDAAEKNDVPDLTDDSTKSASQLLSDYLSKNDDMNFSYGPILYGIKDSDVLKELIDNFNLYGNDWAKDVLEKITEIVLEDDGVSDEELAKIVKNVIDDNRFLSVNQALEGEGLWNEKRELRTLTKMLPQLSKEGRIAVVNGLIRASSREGDYAWGRFKDGIITISDHAVVGTPYHEAFHYVLNMLLTDREIESVFLAAREKFGERNVVELEELLAEDFRKYMNRETDGKISRVKRFWRRIKHVVNSLFGNTSILDNMYYNIMSGRYGKRDERTKVKYESFEDRLNKLNSEIDCILAAAPRNVNNRLLAPNGSISALDETAYALARSSRFYEWNNNMSKLAGTDAVRTRNGEPAVLYLTPQGFNIFTTQPITEYDKPYFVNGNYTLAGSGNVVIMNGAFDTFPIDIERVAGVITTKPNTTGNVEKYMRASDIRDYHEFKTDYDNLNAEQKEFVDRMARHEWQALDADTRDLALYCIM